MVRLEEVAQVNPRRPVLSIELQTPITFVPMASVGEKSAGILCREQREYREVAKGYTYFEENNVLFAKITPCLQNGKHALATGLRAGFGFGTTEFHVVRAGSKVEPRHLFRVLTHPQNIDKCTRSFSGTAGQQRVQPEVLKSLRILLPPLPEQRAIAGVLDAIDEAIERTEAVIAATERLRDSLLHELLTRGVPGWHREWKEVAGVGTVPACWEVVRLGEVAEVQTGRAVNRKSVKQWDVEIPYLSVANVKDGYLDLSAVKTMRVSTSEIDRYRLLQGDVLFTEGGDADKLGRGTVWQGEIEQCLHQNHVFAVRTRRTALQPEFLAAYAASGPGKRFFLNAAKQTTNLASVNATQLRKMPIPVPDIREQAKVDGLLSAAGRLNTQARVERDALLMLKISSADALLTGRSRFVQSERYS